MSPAKQRVRFARDQRPRAGQGGPAARPTKVHAQRDAAFAGRRDHGVGVLERRGERFFEHDVDAVRSDPVYQVDMLSRGRADHGDVGPGALEEVIEVVEDETVVESEIGDDRLDLGSTLVPQADEFRRRMIQGQPDLIPACMCENPITAIRHRLSDFIVALILRFVLTVRFALPRHYRCSLERVVYAHV